MHIRDVAPFFVAAAGLAIALGGGLAPASAAPKKTTEKVDPILAKYDVDKDGKLSRDERRAWRADRRAAALKAYDANGDGKLDRDERKRLTRDRVNDLLAALDRDKNGKLSRLEIGKARGIRFERLRRGFERIDADGNGELNRTELESIMQRRRRGRKGPRHHGKRKHRSGDSV